MSSPAAAPTPANRPRPATATQPSTPGPTGTATPGQHPTPNHATPSSQTGQHAPFLSPSVTRVAGKAPAGKGIGGKGISGKGLQGQHASSPAVGGTSMAATPSQTGASSHVNLGGTVTSSFDSPSHAALAAVGMEHTSSSNAMNLSLSGLGLNNMSMLGSLSQGMLGGGSSMGLVHKLDDAERRRKLESVLNTLGASAGRISQEGVERLARRMGLEIYDETREGERSLMIAGKSVFAVDIVFRPSTSPTVARTDFQFHGVNDATIADFSPAAAILRDDLSPPKGISPINAKLDSFAKNLEEISKLEKLSGSSANCFEAISGIHQSLKKIYEHEKQLAKTLMSSQSLDPETITMCKKGGQPRMNARKTVGLSVDYWRDKHQILLDNKLGATTDDQDQQMTDMFDEPEPDPTDAERQIYSLHIDCEASSPALYTPIRSSTAWVAGNVTKSKDDPDHQAADTGQQPLPDLNIDWRDPAANATTGDVATDLTAPLPQARFVAHMQPPIALPLNVAAQIYASVGLDITAGNIQQTTWDTLVIPAKAHSQQQAHSINNEPLTSKKNVFTFPAGDGAKEQTWTSRLYFHHPELGRLVDTVPFVHPRQLIAMLPVLRQYTLFTKLILSAAPDISSVDSLSAESVTEHGNPLSVKTELDDFLQERTSSVEESGNMAEDVEAQDESPRVIDVQVVQIAPIPRFVLVMSTKRGLLNLTVEVTSNGGVSVSQAGNTIKAMREAAGESGEERIEKLRVGLEKALSACEDLPTLAEFARERYAGR